MAEAGQPETKLTPPNNSGEDARERLDQITKRAAAKAAVKDFNAAAELYSEATELQAELNGELSPDNADLLFVYGKALYNVAVSKSDVLGSKVAEQPKPQSSSTSTRDVTQTEKPSAGGSSIQNAISSGLARKDAEESEKSQSEGLQKPYFQFTGDEAFDDTDSEEGDGAAGGDEDEDDFANAFEVLDLARVLYLKRLDAMEESQNKGKSTAMAPDLRLIKERLADTHDLQAEISLEGERFMDAITDLRKTLELRQSLFPFEDSFIAESHYKLSLALEFASANKQNEKNGEVDNNVDEAMRKEAISQMESAIESCKIRVAQEQRKLDDNSSTMDEDKISAANLRIADVKDMMAEMEQRLVDLRNPPASARDEDQKDKALLKGILGQIVGQSPAEQKTKLDAVSREANDLSAFVKRKPAPSQPRQQDSSHKRLAETTDEGDTKRARVDNPQQS
ncbi:histone H1-binding protein [Aspergillus sclerotialis]|uniref:Histone H1-binding protein n=1 Tax=Aspergillus sclerotialis TaxID=2070753 RepID=A0A3A2ZTZ1_9EURO|nr:histone H1-binding protein [Aspergillus sclerotialis]